MHLLGKPDLIVSNTLLREVYGSAIDPGYAAIDLFRFFAVYLVAECPVGKFISGHTFSIDAESPKFQVIWEPCTGYDENNLFFNPFGRWRFAGISR
jgi:hypothetical protein